jgi:hypothetical protein
MSTLVTCDMRPAAFPITNNSLACLISSHILLSFNLPKQLANIVNVYLMSPSPGGMVSSVIYLSLTKRSLPATTYIVPSSIYSTMIRSTLFILVGQFFYMKRGLTMKISYRTRKKTRKDTTNSGGTSSPTFAVGGGASYYDTRVIFLLGSSPCLHSWYPRSRHAGTFTSIASYYRLRRRGL